MPSNKTRRKQVIVDREILAQVRKYGKRFNLRDTRDSAVVDAALREWVKNQATLEEPDIVSDITKNSQWGHEHRLKLIMRVLESKKRDDGTVGPIGHKAVTKLLETEKIGERLSATFVRKAMVELVERGKLETLIPGAGSIGAVYRIVKC